MGLGISHSKTNDSKETKYVIIHWRIIHIAQSTRILFTGRCEIKLNL